MNRRRFLERAGLTTASAGWLGWMPGSAAAEIMAGLGLRTEAGTALASGGRQLDPSDRSPDRDPHEVQRATLVVDGRETGGDTVQNLRRLQTGGVHCSVAQHAGLSQIGASYRFMDEHSDAIAPATSVREIRQIHDAGKIARVFHFQGAAPLERERDWRSALRSYYKLGLRVCAVSHNSDQGRFGGGCLDPNVGLTQEGRQLVEEIHKLGIVLDVAGHTGDQTSLDAIEMSSGVPVICSHANPRALVDNPRNISDQLIEAIARTGGVIGVAAVNDFHIRTRNDAGVRRMPQVELETHLDHYDYFKELVGPDHIALGVDNIEERAATYQGGLRFPQMYSDPGYFYYIEDFDTIAQLPNVTRGLIRRGWSNAELWKLLGQNWLRVYEQVWGA